MRFVAALALALGLGCRLLARLPGHDACELGETVVGGMVEPGARDVVVPVRKKAWEAAFGGEEAARPHVRARLTGWPSRALVDRATLPSTDREFVARLARDTWRGLEAFTDREDHLPVDNVRFAGTSVDGAEARVGDYTNVTSVGLRLIALVAATDLDLVARTEAIRRVRRLLATLEGLETYRGFFYNYYDTTSRERTSNFLSFVDSSWLTAGLMVVRTAFPELGESCSRIIAAQDYRFFYDATRQRMTHGYYVHLAAPSRFHYGTLYAESRLGSLIAIGTGTVPEEHWFAMARTYAAGCRWQTQTPHGRTSKEVRGHRVVDDVDHVRVDAAQGQVIARPRAPDEALEEGLLAGQRRVVGVDDERVPGLHHEDRVLVLVLQAHHADRRRQRGPRLEAEDGDVEAQPLQVVPDLGMIVIGDQHPLRPREPLQRFAVQMVRMAVGDPDEGRGGGVLDLGGGEVVIEGPASEVRGADEPRIGHQDRPAVLEDLKGRISQRLEAESRHGAEPRRAR